MTLTRFLLVRHGETLWNLEHRIQGQGNSELSAAGILQANAIATRLAGERVDRLVSSDLGRTLQTAAPIAAATGLPIELNAGLRERAFGIFEGRTLAEIAAAYPSEHARWRSRDPVWAMPGGESLAEVRARVESTLRHIAGGGARRVVVITHGGVLDAVYRIVTGIADDAPRAWPLVNASMNQIELHEAGWQLHDWGDVSHLDAAADETS